MKNFHAILLEKSETDIFSKTIKTMVQDDLLIQGHNTLVKIDYSSLNYKDALALTNTSPVVRKWPMIPGIDGVGTIIETDDAQLKAGETVILNGFGCGEVHWGCLSEYAILSSKWLIPLPENLTSWQSMALGTAGYTASLAVIKIIDSGIRPEDGEIIVTGSTGGVGSVAIMLLSALGYSVTASTSKVDEEAYLKSLGATNVIDGASLKEKGKPLQKERWIASVDALGSHTLANICAQAKFGGVIVACGLAQGMDLPTSVAPFILRGVTLSGIDSVMAPIDSRIKAWALLDRYINRDFLDVIAHTITLDECFDTADQIIAGKIKGRYVVKIG